MRATIIIAAVAVASTLGLTACGGGGDSATAPRVQPTSGTDFKDESAFEDRIKSAWVGLMNDQNDAGVTVSDVDELDCIKTAPTTASCILVASKESMTVRHDVTVQCEADGSDCLIKTEPINYSSDEGSA